MHKQKGQLQIETERDFCRARILYMEDDAGLSYLLQKKLERMACIVDIAQDGQAGLEMFKNGAYDVVIVDYNMPGVNGIEVLRKLRSLVPVIMLTGEGDENIAVEAMKLGAADYMAKDVDGEYMQFLPSIIDRVMERQELIEDRQQAQAKLQTSEARYRAIVEDQTELICRFQPGGKLSFANAAFCRYFGIRQSEIAFQNLVAILPKKAYQYMTGIHKTLTPQNPVAMNTHNIRMIDEKVCWLQWTSRAIFDDTYKLKEYQLVGRDITELKRAEEALRESEEKNSALLNAIPDPILRIDQHGTCIDLRSKQDQVLVLSPDFIGKNIAEFFPADVVRLMQEHMNKVFQEGTSQLFQFKLRQGESDSFQEARIVYAGGDETLAIVRDVTERTKLEQQLQHLSIHDSLTGLYNRAYFAAEMQRLASGRHSPVGIVVCDVDGLKIVNDNLGHSRGDELLQAAAEAILQVFRGSDAVARIGGDEFAILLPNATQRMLEDACDRLRKVVARHNETKQELFLSISVGAAVSSDENSDLGEVFQQADEAMYGDKLRRSKGVRNAMAQTLREFLERKEICSKEHSSRVKEIMNDFGRILGFAEERLAGLKLFAEYHDIGKVAVPESILTSKGGISSEEYTVIKRHCEIGQRIAAATPKLLPVADWILKHHEWWNGLGYPLGIKGEDIPLECRMLAIVDAYESMIGGRYACAPKSVGVALAELRCCAGTQFDPELVKTFTEMLVRDTGIEELLA